MRFKKGSKVEVLSRKDVPSGSWRCAEIVCRNGHNYMIRYDGCVGVGDEMSMETISRKAIRPYPPPPEVAENWVLGDVVEVFNDFSWKMATISEVLGKNYFVVRLLGSSLEFEVNKFDIRARLSWHDDKWVVIRKGPGHCEDRKHDEKLTLKYSQNSRNRNATTNTMVDVHPKDEFSPVNRGKFQESNIASSTNLKRKPYDCSKVEVHDRAALKRRAIEKGGRRHLLIAIKVPLRQQADAFAFQREIPGQKFDHIRFHEMDVERRKRTGDVGCSFATGLESNSADSLTCSVGSCSITTKSSSKLQHHTSCFEDGDGDCSDAESSCPRQYQEGDGLSPTKEDLAAEIHRLELHAYRCTIETLHASGPLSWEQEALVTNLRLSLHISNDEHLMEVRNLVSANHSIPSR